MRDVVTFNESRSPPGDALDDIAGTNVHHIRLPDQDQDRVNPPSHEEHSAISAMAGDGPNDIVQITPRASRRDRTKRILRATLKSLIAVATAQYVLVTAAAAFAAFVVSSEAGKAINAKLEPIIAALKRL